MFLTDNNTGITHTCVSLSLPHRKQQQIASLFAHNASVITVIDEQQYEVPCPLNDTNSGTESSSIQLLVNLPGAFPEEAPVLTVSPAGMRHPWIESDVIVNDTLTCWSYQSNLGMLVHNVCEEFRQHPPGRRTGGPEDRWVEIV